MSIRIGFVMHAMQVAGAEVLVAEIIRRLGPRIEPTVLCLDSVGPLGEQLRSEGVEVVALDRKPGRDWRLAGRMRRVIQTRGIQLLHAHQYSPFFYAALAKFWSRPRPKLIFTEHGRHFPDVVSRKRRWVNRHFLARLADAMTACCQFAADAVRDVDGFRRRPIEIIENGIDLSRYEASADRGELRRHLGLDPARRYLIMVARFHPIKDHAMLIRAFGDLATTHGDVDLLLAGDGALRADLEQQVRSLGIEPRVKFLGVRRDVPDLLRAADVFTLTSISEAASLTLMEAMACGLPVVVTDVGGNPEIVRDGQEALLVPRGDAAAAASAFRRLLDDPALARRLGEAARERARERYRLDSSVDRYMNLYERVISNQ